MSVFGLASKKSSRTTSRPTFLARTLQSRKPDERSKEVFDKIFQTSRFGTGVFLVVEQLSFESWSMVGKCTITPSISTECLRGCRRRILMSTHFVNKRKNSRNCTTDTQDQSEGTAKNGNR
ncbi:unnamed protein product [Ectocarpus sp. 12 AP-2014]